MKRVIGVISDTHSLLRPEAVAELCDSDVIVHAGDIGDAKILDDLGQIAPVYAVRGNNDRAAWAAVVPGVEMFEFAGQTVYVVHDPAAIDIDPHAAGVDIVITGHTHRPRLEDVEGVTYLNPGSAGPRRFRLPIAMARIEIEVDQVQIRLIELAVR